MLSKSEWRTEMQRSAARKIGENSAGWFFFVRFLAGPLSVLIAVGLAGFGAWWVWDQAVSALETNSVAQSSPVPAAFWLAAALLAIGTAIAFRPRIIPAAAHITILKVAVFGLLWLGVIAYGVSLWLS